MVVNKSNHYSKKCPLGERRRGRGGDIGMCLIDLNKNFSIAMLLFGRDEVHVVGCNFDFERDPFSIGDMKYKRHWI